MMVQIEYDAISILEVVVPPFNIRHDPVIRAALHDKEIEKLRSTANEMYDKLAEKINVLLSDVKENQYPSKEALDQLMVAFQGWFLWLSLLFFYSFDGSFVWCFFFFLSYQ